MRIRLSRLKYIVESSLNEGGNTRAIDLQTGEIKKFAGKTAVADKVDMGEIDRSTFKRDIIGALVALDDLFLQETGKPLWPDAKKRNEILQSGEAFNGSSSHLFGKSVSDAEFKKFKPKVGDIDLTIPEENIKPLFDVLRKYEEKQITPNVAYIGQNKMAQGGEQINALFSYVHGKSTRPIFVQIDFEAVEYEGGRPNEFAKFGHSSSWDDIKANVKGVFHKYLMRSLTQFSEVNDVVVITGKSKLWPPSAVRLSKETAIKLKAFSITKGIRDVYERVHYPMNADDPLVQVKKDKKGKDIEPGIPDAFLGKPMEIDGKPVFRELSTSASKYTSDLTSICSLLFARPGQEEFEPPNPEHVKMLWSFTGLLAIIKDHDMPDEDVEKVYLDFVGEKLFGPKSQRLSASNFIEDIEAKDAAVGKFKEEFPQLGKFDARLEKLRDEYYGVDLSGNIDGSKYKTRVIETALANVLMLVEGKHA